MWTILHARLHTTLKQTELIARSQKILIAVSGGQDSVCLLKLLLDLQAKWDWQLAVGYCDHQWKNDIGIADFVRKTAEKWKVPFYIKTAFYLKETEAAAREWRYQALEEIAREQGFKLLVTGHTQSDRSETLLYNLMRGAGIDGMSALNWKRELSPTLSLVRPLLNITRVETGQFCQQLQLPIWDDRANHNLDYARNRIRQQMIPYLKAYFNPHLEATLAQTAEILKAESDLLASLTEDLTDEIIDIEQEKLNRIKLKKVPLALQRRVIKRFLENVLAKATNFEQIEAIVYLIDAPQRSRTSSLARNTIAQVQGDWIVIERL